MTDDDEDEPCPVCGYVDYAECPCAFEDVFDLATKLRADLAAMTAVIEALRELRSGCGTFSIAGRGRNLWAALDALYPDGSKPPASEWVAKRFCDVAVKRADALTEALREVLDALPSSCSDGSHGDELAEQITDAEALLAGTQGEDDQ